MSTSVRGERMLKPKKHGLGLAAFSFFFRRCQLLNIVSDQAWLCVVSISINSANNASRLHASAGEGNANGTGGVRMLVAGAQ